MTGVWFFVLIYMYELTRATESDDIGNAGNKLEGIARSSVYLHQAMQSLLANAPPNRKRPTGAGKEQELEVALPLLLHVQRTWGRLFLKQEEIKQEPSRSQPNWKTTGKTNVLNCVYFLTRVTDRYYLIDFEEFV